MTLLSNKIAMLPGPILVLGASGFIGANLFRHLIQSRDDVFGTTSRSNAWRLQGVNNNAIKIVNLLADFEVKQLLDSVKPRTVFNCAAYGAYSFETNVAQIYRTNFDLVVKLLEQLSTFDIASFVHAGTSSEYGQMSAGPSEETPLVPNSHYAVSKASAAAAIAYMGAERGLPCVNLRLYSVYGPMEDSSRLIPQVVIHGNRGQLPEFVDAEVSRDFVYVDDAVEAFVDASRQMTPALFGQVFNIGTGRRTSILDVAELAQELFQIKEAPVFTMENRHWDRNDWYADPSRAAELLDWQAQIDFRSGLTATSTWYLGLDEGEQKRFRDETKQAVQPDTRYSVSAVVACYKDGEAIPILYERLSETFRKLSLDYEIIFVNDASPDSSEEVIQALTATDHRVVGISHSRNFGSQAAFRSGMEIATKNAVVLLDGDLQDPPELIIEFVQQWRAGYDVVYGRRVKREAPWYMQWAYKAFYRVFDRFSYIAIPHDAGDFSLLDIRVVRQLLNFPERDMFLRGARAFVGFAQTGVDYVRPERLFGSTTNSFFKNIGWAKKGIFSFSYVPLTILTAFSTVAFLGSLLLIVYQVVAKLLFPEIAPKGITTLLLVNLAFGSLILLSVSLLGEYIARIFEEVKQRPRFIRRALLRDGEKRDL